MDARTSPRFGWKRIVGLAALLLVLGLGVVVFSAIRTVKANSQASVITCNLSQLEAAANQYCIENSRDRATYDDVVGPGKWIGSLKNAAGEDYRTLVIWPGRPVSIRTPDGREFTFTPKSYLRADRPKPAPATGAARD
jgi:hypothetical protein